MNIKSGLTEVDIAFTCWLLWHIWRSRNVKVFDNVEPTPVRVLDLAKYSHFEFWLACDSPTNRVSTVIHPNVKH